MKTIKQNPAKHVWTQVILYSKATKKAWDDLARMIETIALLVTVTTAFWYGYTHDFQVDSFRYVICGSAILMGLVAGDLWLKNYKKKVENEDK